MRQLAWLVAVTVAMTGCAAAEEAVFDPDVVVATTGSVGAPSTTATSTSLVATTSTTAATPTTTFEAPPATAPDPALADFVGLWRWPGTHTRYLQLQDHGAIATGDVVDDTLRLIRTGRWTVADGTMEVRFLEAGGTCADDQVGRYTVTRSSTRLTMTVVADDCETRARWLIGDDRTTRTWIAADIDP